MSRYLDFFHWPDAPGGMTQNLHKLFFKLQIFLAGQITNPCESVARLVGKETCSTSQITKYENKDIKN